jgi:arginase family enzyme
MDIAEMNPKYDIDGRTAKLAGRLVWEVSVCTHF